MSDSLSVLFEVTALKDSQYDVTFSKLVPSLKGRLLYHQRSGLAWLSSLSPSSLIFLERSLILHRAFCTFGAIHVSNFTSLRCETNKPHGRRKADATTSLSPRFFQTLCHLDRPLLQVHEQSSVWSSRGRDRPWKVGAGRRAPGVTRLAL